MSNSLWLSTAYPRDPFPKLDGDVHVTFASSEAD